MSLSTSRPVTYSIWVSRLSKICESLGYELGYMEDCRLPFEQALNQPITKKRHFGPAQPNASKRPRLSQSQSTSSNSTPNQAIRNCEETTTGTNVALSAESIPESTFPPNAMSGTEVQTGSCQSDVTSGVGFSLQLSNAPLLQGQSPQRPRSPAEQLSLCITQPESVPDRDCPTLPPIFDDLVPHRSQPTASYPEDYSILDWEKDFLLLDWERDYDYTAFHSGNWQDRHS